MTPTDSVVASFRARYRAGIAAGYSGPRHALWVASVGGLAMLWSALQLQAVQPLEWLVLLAALLVGNVGEYAIHRRLGHHKWAPAKLFYQRHTGDHHSFFTDRQMLWDTSRDWRVVLFPGWLILVVLAVVAAPGAWALASVASHNAAWLWVLGVTATYLLYEMLHFSYHLPREHWLHRHVPGLWRLRHLHVLHHQRQHMTEINFNLTFPLTDWLMGTLHWQPERQDDAAGPHAG